MASFCRTVKSLNMRRIIPCLEDPERPLESETSTVRGWWTFGFWFRDSDTCPSAKLGAQTMPKEPLVHPHGRERTEVGIWDENEVPDGIRPNTSAGDVLVA